MTAAAWIALGFGVVTLIFNLVVFGIGYGVLRGTVAALAARVTALEGEMSALIELKVEVTRIGTRQETWIEQLKDLNSSIRWMRDPAASFEPKPK